MIGNKFQASVATGRLTLPVVVLICLVLWVLGLGAWKDLGTLAVTALTGYLMIEANTAFSLIRTRTTLPVCNYWFWMSALPFLHTFGWSCLAPLCFMTAIIQLFRGYESPYAPTDCFHAFFFLALGSLVFPQMLWFVPLFLYGSISFRALTLKSFVASLLGLSAPYWFLFGHAYWHDDMALFLAPLRESIHFRAIDYSVLPLSQLVSWASVTMLQVVCSVHYLQVSYQDKTRTRIYLTFLVIAGGWALLMAVLQPQHLYPLLPMQIICTSFLAAHLFTLTRNRFSGIFFVVTFAGILILTAYNLWMQYFNS